MTEQKQLEELEARLNERLDGLLATLVEQIRRSNSENALEHQAQAEELKRVHAKFDALDAKYDEALRILKGMIAGIEESERQIEGEYAYAQRGGDNGNSGRKKARTAGYDTGSPVTVAG